MKKLNIVNVKPREDFEIREVYGYRFPIFVKCEDGTYYACNDKGMAVFMYDNSGPKFSLDEIGEVINPVGEKLFSPELFLIMLRNMLLKEHVNNVENGIDATHVRVLGRSGNVTTCDIKIISSPMMSIMFEYGFFEPVFIKLHDLSYVVVTENMEKMLKNWYGIEDITGILDEFVQEEQ